MEYQFDKDTCRYFEEPNFCKCANSSIALGLKPAPGAKQNNYGTDGTGYDKYVLPEDIELCRGCVSNSGRDMENSQMMAVVNYKLFNPLREKPKSLVDA